MKSSRPGAFFNHESFITFPNSPMVVVPSSFPLCIAIFHSLHFARIASISCFKNMLIYSCMKYLTILFFFLPCLPTFGILVPLPGIEPGPLAVKGWSPNHWPTGELPLSILLNTSLSLIMFSLSF